MEKILFRSYLCIKIVLCHCFNDLFHVVGLVVGTGQTAGTNITITKVGPMTATTHGLPIGKPIYLAGETGGLSDIAPTTAGEAVVKVGVAMDANTIDVQIQIMGVN